MTLEESESALDKKTDVRPMMEACGIDVYKTVRSAGFEIDTRLETYGKWNYYAMILLE